MKPMEKIRILVVDDQRIVREGLVKILEMEENLEVVGGAENGEKAYNLVARYRPDIVLMDIRMPVVDGVEATRKIKEDYPETEVIILTTFDDDELVIGGLEAGACTYLLKDVPSRTLVRAIKGVFREEEVFLPPDIARKLVDRAKGEKKKTQEQEMVLTTREKEVLSLMAKGLNNLEIADKLYLTEGTVKNYVSNIYSKLGTRDRTRVVLWALKNKLI